MRDVTAGVEPRTRRGRESRAAFVDAARERFLVDGYLNVSVPSIARTAGRSSASFYTYFDSKADLLNTLAVESIDALRTQLEHDVAGDGSDDTISRVTATVWSAYRDDLPILLSIFQTAMRDLELERWQTLRGALVGAITAVNKRAETKGATPPVDHDRTARALASMMEMFCFVWLAQGGDVADTVMTDDLAVATMSRIWSATLTAPAATAS